ncbi:hypothetical protein EB796_007582 [Bugula neritina]|uniref:Uncharacterized protein n=1 Tax=Bugula neritina TaxID=10212 RepID=A0A7J7K7C3_BUGNE|nr:hypothetical protein EB796_007582 [Bugula neritina]
MMCLAMLNITVFQFFLLSSRVRRLQILKISWKSNLYHQLFRVHHRILLHMWMSNTTSSNIRLCAINGNLCYICPYGAN